MTDVSVCEYRMGPAMGLNTIFIGEGGDGKWTVSHLGRGYLNKDGNWEVSDREKSFLERTRFTLEEALELAAREYERGGWAA